MIPIVAPGVKFTALHSKSMIILNIEIKWAN